MMPGGRGHEYVRVSDRGMRTKLGIDATVPYEDRARFQRVQFADAEVSRGRFSTDASALRMLISDTN
jgi:2,5-furandicarboxylate decarboxylase 1